MSKFPDFIICGFMKCGTTVAWHNLNKHPDIVMGKNFDDPKKASTEIRFWNNGKPHRVRKNGEDWYRGLFSGKCSGEKCANYIESAKTMNNIFDGVPSVKIILCIRNPVDRAYSEFQMMKKTRPNIYKIGFSKLIRKNSEIISKGMYFSQIKKNILPFFDKDDIFISIQERMKYDLNMELNKIYNFLNVDTIEHKTHRVSSKDKDGDVSGYRSWSSKYPPMTKSDRKYLNKKFKSSADDIRRFIGDTVEEWRL
jgi:hypothetical protein